MIDLELRITNPYSYNEWDWKCLSSGGVTQNVAYELNRYRNKILIGFSLRVNVDGDHRGVTFNIGILGRELELSVYDTRHRDMYDDDIPF